MRLVLHIGAYGTDGGRLAGWIARNQGILEGDGVAAPPPRLFLARISEALDRGRDDDPLEREEALLRGLGASGQRRRMVVCAPGLLGAASDVVSADGFYHHDVARRLYALSALFPRTKITVMLAVRRASGMIPALLPAGAEDDSARAAAAEAWLREIPDDTLPWSRLAATIRQQLPGAELVAWRHEDLPRVWPGVLGEMVGPQAPLPPTGLLDFAAAGLSAEARLRMTRYLAGAEAPPTSAGQLRKVAEAFADRFGAAPERDATADLPGWVRVRLAELDAGYVTEWADIAGMPGVRVLMP